MAVFDASVFRGSRIEDRYELGSVLRQRLNSWSFLATDLESRSQVVVRIIGMSAANLSAKPAEERFGHLTRISHESIVSYLRISLTELPGLRSPVLFAVRPYREYSLNMAGPGTLSLGQGWRLLQSVLEGLGHLHRNNLMHGDLRPENIFIARGAYEVTDYCLPALGIDPFDNPTPRSLHFVAPEVQSGSPRPASDIYSFGMLMLYLLAENAETSLRGREADAPQRASVSRARRVAHLCLRREPERRPSVSALLDVLFDDATATRAGVVELLRDPATLALARTSLRERHALKHAPERSASREQIEAASVGAVAQLERDVVQRPELALRLRDRRVLGHYIASVALSGLLGVEYKLIERVFDDHLTRVDIDRYTAHEQIDDVWISKVTADLRPATDGTADGALGFLPEADRRAIDPSPDELLDQLAKQIFLASEARSDILDDEDFLVTEEVARLLNASCSGANDEDVLIMRERGSLLAMPDHGRWLYPVFQFDTERGVPYEEVKAVNEILDGNSSGWGVMSWWLQPHQYVAWKRPRDLLTDADSRSEIVRAAAISAGAGRRL